jgi:hypothetical protein
MIVFCPNCGTQNEGLPGARAECSACHSSFEVPADAAAPRQASPAPAPTAAPPSASFQAPGSQVFAPIQPGRASGTNPLAIVSLVAGILCCIPLLSPAVAIGCGIGALKQIDASQGGQTGRGLAIAGMILGSITALWHVTALLSSLLRHRY